MWVKTLGFFYNGSFFYVLSKELLQPWSSLPSPPQLARSSPSSSFSGDEINSSSSWSWTSIFTDWKWFGMHSFYLRPKRAGRDEWFFSANQWYDFNASMTQAPTQSNHDYFRGSHTNAFDLSIVIWNFINIELMVFGARLNVARIVDFNLHCATTPFVLCLRA